MPHAQHVATHMWMHFWHVHVLCTNIFTKTHTKNSNTNLLSIDITRMHSQMRKSPRWEKESGKEMRRDRSKKTNRKKEENKRKLKKKKERRINK